MSPKDQKRQRKKAQQKKRGQEARRHQNRQEIIAERRFFATLGQAADPFAALAQYAEEHPWSRLPDNDTA